MVTIENYDTDEHAVRKSSTRGAIAAKSLPKELWIRSKALLTIMHNTSTIDDLKIKGQPSNIRLHKLKGDRKDEWSVKTTNL